MTSARPDPAWELLRLTAQAIRPYHEHSSLEKMFFMVVSSAVHSKTSLSTRSTPTLANLFRDLVLLRALVGRNIHQFME